MISRAAFLVTVAGCLAGCGLFGGKDEDPDPPAELFDFDSQLTVKKVWSNTVGDGTERLRLGLRPATDQARIYAASHDGRIAAYDTVSGKEYWKVKTDLKLAAGPAVGSGLAVVGSSDGDLVALNTRDGSERWRIGVSSEVLASPAVSGKFVVLRTVDGRLRALSAEDGSELWLYEEDVPRLSLRGNSRPVIINDIIICGFDNGKIVALTLEEGDTLWETNVNASRGRTELERLVDIDSEVHVAGNDVYVAGFQGRVAMLALESGQVWWSREISSFNGLGMDPNYLFVANSKSEIQSMTRREGAPQWISKELRRRTLTAPVLYQNSLVVGDFEGYLHFMNASTGQLEARVRTGNDMITNPPIVVDDKIYVQTDGGTVIAYQAAPRGQKSASR